MEQPKRKPTRLKEYDYSQPGAYFVTVCTQGRRCLLSIIVGEGSPLPQLTKSGKCVRDFIENISEKYPTVQVDKYIIMPNYVHFLLRILPAGEFGGTGNPSPTLSAVMGWWKYATTKAVHECGDLIGERVWQRSYYDHVIRGEEDYRQIWQYIDENPLK